MNNINTLIFDLGGVIINLDVNKTIEDLTKLSRLTSQQIQDIYLEEQFFKSYEKGLISDADFRKSVRIFLNKEIEDSELDNAWNAMVLDLPINRLKYLKKLSKNYALFLLSNTNSIHLKKVHENFQPIESENLDDYFTQTYYSHELGMRKPDTEIFEFIIDTQKLNPSQTLFLDDNKENILGAQRAGLKTFYVRKPEDWIKKFFE